jgi:hypothetical protein
MKKLGKQIEHEENYVEFLKKALTSERFKSNVSEEEFEKTKVKYDKAKFRLKTLKM